jgi:hypothetical protein
LQQIRDPFSQKIIFKLGGFHILKALAFISCPCTFSPHSPSFNLAIMGIEPSYAWEKGKELTTNPFLFQVIDMISICFIHVLHLKILNSRDYF